MRVAARQQVSECCVAPTAPMLIWAEPRLPADPMERRPPDPKDHLGHFERHLAKHLARRRRLACLPGRPVPTATMVLAAANRRHRHRPDGHWRQLNGAGIVPAGNI